MTMLEKYREFVQELVDKDCIENDDLAYTAIGLLEEDFKEQVIDLWDYSLTSDWSKEEERKLIKKGNKFNIIHNIYSDDKKKFIEEHWNEVDKIISILQDYIKELKAEEAKEEAKEATTNE